MQDARWLAALCVGCLMLLGQLTDAQRHELTDPLRIGSPAAQARDSVDFAQGLRDCNPKEKRRAACLDGQCVSLQTSSVHSYLICRCPAGRMGRRCEERSPSPEMITFMAQRLSEMPKEVRCNTMNYNILMRNGYESSLVECLRYEEQEYKKKLTPLARAGGGNGGSGGASRSPPKRKKTTAPSMPSTSTMSAAMTTTPMPSASSSTQSRSPRSTSPPSARPTRHRLTMGGFTQPPTAASFEGPVTFTATARLHPASEATPRLKIRHHRFLRL